MKCEQGSGLGQGALLFEAAHRGTDLADQVQPAVGFGAEALAGAAAAQWRRLCRIENTEFSLRAAKEFRDQLPSGLLITAAKPRLPDLERLTAPHTLDPEAVQGPRDTPLGRQVGEALPRPPEQGTGVAGSVTSRTGGEKTA
ncbi:MAG TPA: hypothetical protein PLG50_01815 [bacterium]|nr:hypothetical protein [bacterium]